MRYREARLSPSASKDERQASDCNSFSFCHSSLSFLVHHGLEGVGSLPYFCIVPQFSAHDLHQLMKKVLTTVNQSFSMHRLFDNGFQFQLAIFRRATRVWSPSLVGTVHKKAKVHPLQIERRKIEVIQNRIKTGNKTLCPSRL